MWYMVACLRDDTRRIEITQSEVAYICIHLRGGITLMDFILALVMRDIITITVIILIGGVGSSIF